MGGEEARGREERERENRGRGRNLNPPGVAARPIDDRRADQSRRGPRAPAPPGPLPRVRLRGTDGGVGGSVLCSRPRQRRRRRIC
jgi:hypothetical protein